MKLFAQIIDPNGLTDGVQGYASNFAVVAETDEEAEAFAEHGSLTWARSVKALAAHLGRQAWRSYVPAPNTQCAGWRYENGAFINPDPES